MMTAGTSKFANGINGETGSEAFSLRKSLFNLVEVTNHVMIFLVTGYILYRAGEKLSVVNVHAGLLTVGYVMLMSEAIAALSGDSLLTNRFPRRVIGHIHWVMQCLGAAFSIAGVVIMYKVKGKHFKSIHGILGLSSIVIMLVLGFSGILVVYAARLRQQIRPVISKLFHNFLGISCFVLGMAAQCYGYKYSVVEKKLSVPCIVLTVLIIIFSLLGALRSFRRQAIGTFT